MVNGSARNNVFTRWGARYFVWWQLSSFMSYLVRWVQWLDYRKDDCTWDLSTRTRFSLRHSYQPGCNSRSVTAPIPTLNREGKTAKTWSLPVTSILCHGSEYVEETYGPIITSQTSETGNQRNSAKRSLLTSEVRD